MQQQSNRGYGLIQDSGLYSSSCGYCNNTTDDQSTTHGMQAYRLTVHDYQELLDQGWRRSGKFLYKPNNKTTCCRQYTIRLNVDNFQPTKAHKRLLRKWDQFLAGQLQPGQGVVHMAGSSGQQQGQHAGSSPSSQRGSKRSRQISIGSTAAAAAAGPAGSASVADALTATVPPDEQQQQQVATACPAHLQTEVQSLLQQAVSHLALQGQLPQQHLPAVKVMAPPPQKLPKLPAGTVLTSSCAHAWAAAARKWQQQQQQQSGGSGNISSSLAASGSEAGAVTVAWGSADELAQAIVNIFNGMAAAANMSTAVIAGAAKGHINFSIEQQSAGDENREQTQHQWQQQQQSRHSSTEQSKHQQHGLQQEQVNRQQHQSFVQEEQGGQQQQPHQLEVRMVPNKFTQEEYELYCKYQINQHHDASQDLTPARYKNFLVDTPLIPVMPPAAAAAGMPPCGYGSFHQQYWLDGKLVAVGVVDVLPRCLSSKYFFWDPDYAWLSLGRYGALREVSWVRAAHAAGAADFQYYYLGFYIHTCPKMAYKAEYAPSELLCPQRQVWVTIDKTVLQALDDAPYVVLSDLPGVKLQPNLSVPRQLPAAQGSARATTTTAAAAAAVEAGSSTVVAGGGSTAAAGLGLTSLSTGANDAGSAGVCGGSSLPSLACGAVPEQVELQAQTTIQQQQRQALGSQLLFLLKQPVRWGALRDSGMLDGEQVAKMEERLLQWRSVVGETAAHLLYATTDVLSVG